MGLKQISFAPVEESLPTHISEFLREAELSVEQHRIDTATNYRGFVPSDYRLIYHCLSDIYDSSLLTGDRFCEWGSGVGVVASLAAFVGFESCGIEYNVDLFEVANQLKSKYEIPVDLVCGSYVPSGIESLIDEEFAKQEGELSLYPEADHAYEELGYDVDEFDLVFCFPWPTDIELTMRMFEQYAATGAMLLIYFATESVGLFRKES